MNRVSAHDRMSDVAVRAKTGKTWAEWFAVLDAAGAQSMTDQQLAAHLGEEHAAAPWWRQAVVVTYLQQRVEESKPRR